METLLDRRPWLSTLALAVLAGAAFHLALRPDGPAAGLWLVPAVVVLLGVTQSFLRLTVAALLLTVQGGAALLGASWAPALTGVMAVYWLALFLGGMLAVRGASRCLPPLLVAFVFPCLLVVVEWGMGLTPVGTALAWAYLQHDALLLIQTASVTGYAGVSFLVAFTGTAAGLLLLRPRAAGFWVLPVGLAVVLLLAAGWYGGRRLADPAGPAVTVAAIHAPSSAGNPDDRDGTLARVDAYRPLVAEAVARGARLVVWPEMILTMAPGYEDTLMTVLCTMAREHAATMVVGFKDQGRNLNIVRVLESDGDVGGEYHKRHLVTRHEGSEPGETPPAVVVTEFGRIGTMICNDDTFTDVARANARLGAQLIADPTWDWSAVAALHARMPRFRAIENGVPVVRAARGGESQLIDARGRILARHDVLAEPRQVLVGDLPLGTGDTPYARRGDVFTLAAASLLGLILVTGLLSRMGAVRA